LWIPPERLSALLFPIQRHDSGLTLGATSLKR
jgi:hypothetical protein